MKRLRTRNRVRGGNGASSGVPRVLFAILLFAIVGCFAYLELSNRCIELGQMIKSKEERLRTLQADTTLAQGEWARYSSPDAIHQLIKAFNLDLGYPDQRNIVRLGEAPGTAIPQPLQIARQRGTGRYD